MSIPLAKFSLNKFWSDTPTLLKYILIIVIGSCILYFAIAKFVYSDQINELKRTEQGITLTYQLVEKIEKYQTTQDNYNKEFSSQLQNVYKLVKELQDNTGSKLDILINSNNKNKDVIIDKLKLLNDSFDKLSEAYKPENVPNNGNIIVHKKSNP